MKLIAHFQYSENYGDEREPYWKMKGGDSVVIATLSVEQAQRGRDVLEDAVHTAIRDRELAWDNPHSRQWLIDWELVSDDEFMFFEDVDAMELACFGPDATHDYIGHARLETEKSVWMARRLEVA